ncbi:UNVERIFIED_ORG: putative Tic20 family protein [Rhodococcus erythropolis]
MTTRKPKVPTYPGQGRRMQIEGSVVCLIAVALIGIAMYATGTNSPIGFTVAAIGTLIALTGVYRAYRGSLLEYLENTIGPSLFHGNTPAAE